VYVDGRLMTTLKGDRIVAEFLQILEEYVASHYASDPSSLTLLGASSTSPRKPF
jgi:hypothetical protein